MRSRRMFTGVCACLWEGGLHFEVILAMFPIQLGQVHVQLAPSWRINIEVGCLKTPQVEAVLEGNAQTGQQHLDEKADPSISPYASSGWRFGASGPSQSARIRV